MTLHCRHRAGAALMAFAAICGPAWSEAPRGSDFAAAMAAIEAGDAATAVALFGDLAAAGDPAAQLNLAVLTARGEGVPQNDAAAAYWAWRARLGGLAAAVSASDHLTGRLGPEARAALARRLRDDLSAIAETGSAWAFLGMARVELALAERPDPARAYAAAALAAALDVRGAAALRDALAVDLTQAARSAAQAEAAALFAGWCARTTRAPASCAAGTATPAG